MELDINDGSRPSRLQLGRYAAGELGPDEEAALEQALTTEDRNYLEQIRTADVPPLDLEGVRERARLLAQPPATALPRPANNGRWLWMLALAAAALLVAVPLISGLPGAITAPGVEPGYHAFRAGGEPALQVFVLRDRALRPWDGEPVSEGDTLGFQVLAGKHEHVVLLSVDGDGRVSVLWPDAGQEAEPISGRGFVALPGTVVLDDAPGPEVFVAVFGETADRAHHLAGSAWDDGGPEGLAEWVRSEDHVDAAAVPRR